MKVTLTRRQARVVRWWAKRRGISVDQVIADIFYSFFHVVSGEFERDTAAARKARRRAA